MSNRRTISAIADPKARIWYPLGMSTVVLAIAIAALFLTFSIQLSPCTGVAQAAQCQVGDDETFSGDTTFQGEINVGATPGPGTSGFVMVSQGASASPEWRAENAINAFKAATESLTTDTTLQDDDDFSFTVDANSYYAFDALIVLDTPTAADFKFDFNGPAGFTYTGILTTHNSATSIDIFVETLDEAVLVTTGNEMTLRLAGEMTTLATSGTATFRWAQNSSSGTTNVRESSWMRFTKLN